ncbi:MAG: thioesterase family protein [Gammaproteobacteria bacterium]
MSDQQPSDAGYFVLDGDDYRPLPPAMSPWTEGLQSGTAMAGLLASAIEDVPAPCPMLATSFKLDVLRPVPFRRTQARATVVREGRKLQVVRATLAVDGAECAVATVVRLRTTPSPIPSPPAQTLRRYPGPEFGHVPSTPMRSAAARRAYELRVIAGSFDSRGPGAVWMRMRTAVIAGRPVSPFVHAAVLGDFGSGVGNVLDRGEFTYANVDISVHMHREPAGEWLLVDAVTATEGLGVALVSGILADARGEFGRAHQSLIIEPLDPMKST